MEAEGQQPAAESIVHEIAKPAARLTAWSAVAAGAGALIAATIRNIREA